ncbi:capsular polysaccharide synthesis protein [Aggregatibacter actinomycetemcomitans]|uniref:capsular polysaccharide synthesis protein n=1 Tax=Aggregatibacter actinomycetemcomitans TaxID=714 RepID=UPI00023FFF08|nr:capsular polysaccharide synthesis protein [Aggregatibacter actinomycetemcomitans]EHK90794.1 capsular polysaccharide synthesis [Aggregatibacter actinomycetemcomitans RhAA1]KNE77840.1 capsular biosynthesis protein [Aggregatibacter actinomycetemcomitans RhAA1]
MSLSTLFSSNATFFNVIHKISNKPYKIFYTGLIPKPIRRWLAKKANLSQQNHVANCWKEVISLYLNGKLDEIMIKPKKDLGNKKIIWQYWGQGWGSENLPDIVKICRRSVQENKGDYEVIYLDDQNLIEYIEFPDFVSEKRKNTSFRHVFFSDLLRLALLKCYGGIWVDATFLFTALIPSKFSSMDFFVFQRSPLAQNKEKWQRLNSDYFSWKENHRANFLSSIMFSKSGNRTVIMLLQLMLWYWKTQENIPHYFFFQILFDELKKENLIEEFELVDDTLPHLLFSELNNPFDKNRLDEITAQCNQHKLTYIKNCQPNSFYAYLKQKYQ